MIITGREIYDAVREEKTCELLPQEPNHLSTQLMHSDYKHVYLWDSVFPDAAIKATIPASAPHCQVSVGGEEVPAKRSKHRKKHSHTQECIL